MARRAARLAAARRAVARRALTHRLKRRRVARRALLARRGVARRGVLRRSPWCPWSSHQGRMPAMARRVVLQRRPPGCQPSSRQSRNAVMARRAVPERRCPGRLLSSRQSRVRVRSQQRLLALAGHQMQSDLLWPHGFSSHARKFRSHAKQPPVQRKLRGCEKHAGLRCRLLDDGASPFPSLRAQAASDCHEQRLRTTRRCSQQRLLPPAVLSRSASIVYRSSWNFVQQLSFRNFLRALLQRHRKSGMDGG